VRSLACRSRSSSGGSPQRVAKNLRMESVLYRVWSTNPFFANGEMITAGTRCPGPQRSMTGGGAVIPAPAVLVVGDDDHGGRPYRAVLDCLYRAGILPIMPTQRYKNIASGSIISLATSNRTFPLKVVRAAYRKPLQFIELMTVTGQASASVPKNSVRGFLPLFRYN
jgi:hypothetical protein